MDGNLNSRNSIYMNINFFVDDIEFSGILDSGIYHEIQSETLHKHFQYEIHTIIDGVWELKCINADNNRVLEKDTVLLIPPECYHGVKPSKINTKRFGIRFEVSKVKSESPRKIYDRFVARMKANGNTPIVLKEMGISQYVYAIIEEFKQDSIGRHHAMQAWLTIVVSNLLRRLLTDDAKEKDTHSPSVSKDSNALRKAKIDDFIGVHYGEPKLNINALEKELNISLRQINRIFNQYYGCTFKQYLTEVRLSIAAKMLLEKELPIEEIALRVGFGGVQSFYAAFKNKYNCTPNKYRNKNYNGSLPIVGVKIE